MTGIRVYHNVDLPHLCFVGFNSMVLLESEHMISVIVPVYRVERYLRQCLDSIISQTYEDLEIILVVDASPDNCGLICDEYAKRDRRVRVFHNKTNIGVSATRNRGLEEARGEYIGFVDPDDWIELDMYESLLKGIEDADICNCAYIWEETENPQQPIALFSAEFDNPYESLRALVEGRLNVNLWNKLFRSDVFSSLCFPEGHTYEDVAMMHRILAQTKKTIMIPCIGYHRRGREGSITKTMSADILLDHAEACISRYNYFKNEQPDLFKECERILSIQCVNSISNVWNRWYGLYDKEVGGYKERIVKICQFSKNNLSPFMPGEISLGQRVTLFFSTHKNRASFAVIYFIRQAYLRMIK